MILETPRLHLRRFEVADAESFYHLNRDPEVMRYTGDVAFASIAASEAFLRSYRAYEDGGFGRMTVVLRNVGDILGWCGLKRHPDGMVDLGYRFHRKYWGHGYATEAARACLDDGFRNDLNLHEIVGRTARENTASVRVLEKLGMTFWKRAPCEGIIDSVFYRIRRDESFEVVETFPKGLRDHKRPPRSKN